MLKSLLLALLLTLGTPLPFIGTGEQKTLLSSPGKSIVQSLPAREEKTEQKKEKPRSSSFPGFIDLRDGQSVKKTILLVFGAPEATSVEFYARRSNSETPLYLGKAEQQEENKWIFSWDSTHSPSDSYTLFALVDGKAQGGKIFVRVQNSLLPEKISPSSPLVEKSTGMLQETPAKKSEELQSAIERIDKEQEALAKKATEHLTTPQAQSQNNLRAKEEAQEKKETPPDGIKNTPEKKPPGDFHGKVQEEKPLTKETSSETLKATKAPFSKSESAPLAETGKEEPRKNISPAAPVPLNEAKKEIIEQKIKELKAGSEHIVTAQKIKDIIVEKKPLVDAPGKTREAQQILGEQVAIGQKTGKREDAVFQEKLKETIEGAKTQEEAVSLVSGEIRTLASKNEQAAETIAKTLQPQENPQKTTDSTQALAERVEAEKQVKEEIQQFQQAIQEKQVEKIEVLRDALTKDSDKDGLPDIEEFRLGTDYFNADTDQDGYLDGDEIAKGYDPLKPSPGDKIVFQEPVKSGVESNDLGVLNVELAPRPEKPAENALVLRGKGFPNTFVTLYIYSTPIIVTVRVNEFGFWEYRLDKPLENGPHKVYVAITDNTGNVTKKSNPLAFVQEAQAISIVEARKEGPAQPRFLDISGFDSSSLLIMAAALIGILSIIAGIILIGFVHKRSGTE